MVEFRQTPEGTELERLVRLHFRIEQILDADGQLDLVAYIREWRGVREVLLLHSRTEATAYRTSYVVDPHRPDYVDPERAELIPLGPVVTVVGALLSLPSLTLSGDHRTP
jgi:hypothetical protein